MECLYNLCDGNDAFFKEFLSWETKMMLRFWKNLNIKYYRTIGVDSDSYRKNKKNTSLQRRQIQQICRAYKMRVIQKASIVARIREPWEDDTLNKSG